MNIQKMKIGLLIAVSSLFVAVGFQNCSKVGVSDLASSNDKVVGEGVPDSDDDGTATIGDGPAMPPSDPPPVTQNPPPPQMPPVADDDDDDHGTCDRGNPPGRGQQMPPGQQQAEVEDPEDDVILENPTEADAVALCMTATSSKVRTGSVFNHLRGGGQINVIQSETLRIINDIRGKFVIQGSGTGAKANAIVNTRGALLICNMRVNLLTNTRGQLILVNSKVDVLSNQRGDLRLYNSEVGKWSDVRNRNFRR